MSITPNTNSTLTLTPIFLEENLKAGRYDDKWKGKGTRDRKRAAIHRAEKVFKRAGGFPSQDDIPGSRPELEFFAANHLHTNDLARQAGFKSAHHARKWVKEYATVLDVASGFRDAVEAMRRQDDDWAMLLGHLAGDYGSPVVYGSYEMIPICSLAMRCRERGITIARLTAGAFKEIFSTFPKSKQAAMRKGLLRLHTLRGSNCVPPELLPTVTPDEIHAALPAATRAVPPIHPDFAEIMGRFLTQASEGQVEVLFGLKFRTFATDEKSEARIKNLQDALRWMWHGLVVLGLAHHQKPFAPECLTETSLAIDLVEACSTGKLGPVSSSQTRRDRIHDVIAFLEWNHPGFRARIPEKFFKAKAIRRTAGLDTDDKQRKRTACQNFVHDTELQRRFFLLPRDFFDQAKSVIENFEEHKRADGNGISKRQNQALERSILAALTAIMTPYPARLITINKLKAFGKQPNVRFPEDQRKDSLVLDIPGYIVKNGRFASGVELQPNSEVKPRDILRWYIDHAHPLVLRFKHKRADLRRPELLFTGLHIDTLRRYWAHHVAAKGLDMTPHMCRHFSASLLLNNGATMPDVAALLGISEAVARNNYGFISSTKKIQDMMGVQASIYRDLGL